MEQTKKGMTRQWVPYQRKAFQTLREALCSTPILLFPGHKILYTIVTDAIGAGAKIVLIQNQGSGLQLEVP